MAARLRLAAGGIDAMVLDRTLPDGDGLALARELRASGAGLKVYIAQFIKGKIYSELKVLKKIKMSDMVWMFLRSFSGLFAFLGSYIAFEKLSIGLTGCGGLLSPVP